MSRVMRTFEVPTPRERPAKPRELRITADAPCRLCIELLTRPVRGTDHDPTWCPDCGRDLAEVALLVRESVDRAAYRSAPRKRQARQRPAPTSDQEIVPRFVADVLRWGIQVAHVERAAFGSASPIASMLERVMLYATREVPSSTGTRLELVAGARIGRGVRGTHGAVEGAFYDGPADPTMVDPIAQARYDAIGSEHRTTVDAIVEDGAGEIPVHRLFGNYGHTLTLAHRVAFKLVDAVRLERWAAKLESRDPAPALAASMRLGSERLRAAAEAWWAALPEGA